MPTTTERVIIAGSTSGLGLDMAKRFLAEGDNADQLAHLHPLGRIGEPPEISDAAIYLARASFVTGQVLAVDGGYAHGR